MGEANPSKLLSLFLVLGTWLLTTLIIGIYITSSLKSKLSAIGFSTVDSLSDLAREKNMDPVTLRHLSEHVNIQTQVWNTVYFALLFVTVKDLLFYLF